MRSRILWAGVIAVLMLVVSACGGSSKSDGPSGKVVDVGSDPFGVALSDLCGDKDMKVAMVDGYALNSFRKVTKFIFENQARQCDNITKISYLNANGDPQKYAAAIDSLVSQQFDVIITVDDFGSATLESLRRAYKAGLAVVPFIQDPGGKAGEDYTDFVRLDRANTALVGEWFDKTLKGSGNILMIGGPPGSPASDEHMKALEKGVAPYPGLKILNSTPVAGNWSMTDTQKAVAGALSKYDKIDAVYIDYMALSDAVIRAFKAADKPLPVIGGTSVDNAAGCTLQKNDVTSWALDSGMRVVMVALNIGVADVQGKEYPGKNVLPMEPFADSTADKPVPCDEKLPADADMSSGLSEEILRQILK